MEASALASHPLVAAALSGLNLDKCFDASVDGMICSLLSDLISIGAYDFFAICLVCPVTAVTELIRFTVHGSHGELAEQMPLVQIVVPQVMGLRPKFSASLKVWSPLFTA